MSDVFVSYKAEDRRRVKPLVEALEAEGYSVWWDAQIGGGAAWRQAIETELNAAKSVIVVWSNRSVGPEGEFVQDEATRAKQRHVYVPILIDKVHPPLGFGETQALPLTGWRGNRADPKYQAVLEAVRRTVGGKRRANAAPLLHAHVDRRKMIVGGSVAAVAAVGAGGWAFFRSSSASATGSIAVLPFANLSGDPNQAYFADGMAEEIRSALARLGGLTVIGRTSSEAVRNDDAPTAAKKLGVASILTGSVRQSPSTIRISAELIDGRTGADRWSQDYDRAPGDAIKIQTDIAENVATALSAALGRAARVAIALGGTANAAAQDLYLKAKAQFSADDSEDGWRVTASLLDSAIALDPKFAKAYAKKAIVLNNLNGYFLAKGNRYETGFAQSEAVARRAIALAPDLAAAHFALAAVLMNRLDIGSAAVEFERGHAYAGNDVDDLLAYALFLLTIGKSGEAIELARKVETQDPFNPIAFSREGHALFNAKRFGDAETAYRKALALAPKRTVDRAWLASALLLMRDDPQALAELRKLPADYLFRLCVEAMLFAQEGNRAASDAAVTRAQQVYGDPANYQYAQVFAQRGDSERAFAALDRAWAFRDPGLVEMKTDPFLDPLRNDARFAVLVQKLNYPS